MVAGQIHQLSGLAFISAKAKAYAELLKFRIVVSGFFLLRFRLCSFAILIDQVIVRSFGMLFLGGFLMSGASVTINQIIEKDLDKVMTRTMTRPLANRTGYLFQEAIVFTVDVVSQPV